MDGPRASRHPATAWVDLDRVRGNFEALRSQAGERALIPVLKANAYGHGAIPVARALDSMGAAMFAVAYVDEGVALRQAGIKTPILVLTGFVPGQLPEVLGFHLTPVVSTPEHAAALGEKLSAGRTELSVHLKVDTGMSRLGFSLREIESVVPDLNNFGGIVIEGLMTHLAGAEEDVASTAQQLDEFDEAIRIIRRLGGRPRLIHAANSAGMAALRESHTAVRPGLSLYGLRPGPLSQNPAVRPALELRARVAMVKTILAGRKVSYGGLFEAVSETRIATINAGYADGIPRTDAMREHGVVRHREASLRLAGNVCMDLTMIDATAAPDLAAGDEVTVFGDSPTAYDLGRWAGTNAWQILAGVGGRVPRRYLLGGRIVSEDLQSAGDNDAVL